VVKPVLLGKPCTVQVIHNEKGTFANVQNVLPKTGEFKSTKVSVLYDVDAHDQQAFDKLPNWIQKKVIDSFEWAKIGADKAFPDEPDYTDEDAPVDLSETGF
jgi:hypothetical protein